MLDTRSRDSEPFHRSGLQSPGQIRRRSRPCALSLSTPGHCSSVLSDGRGWVVSAMMQHRERRFPFDSVTDRVLRHGPATFQSFVFTPRLLQRTADMRHVCFANMPTEIRHVTLYIDTVSKPYRRANFQYYQNDKQTIIVEYNEDIGRRRCRCRV
jgi:hypothetical protein